MTASSTSFDPALVAAIPGPHAHGREAKEHPSAVRLREEISKLDSLSGGDVSWPLVETLADELLRTETKDLRVACQLANASLHLHGATGFIRGLGLVQALVQQYWDNMYPQRAKGRVGAVVWLVERADIALATRTFDATQHAALAELDRSVVALRDALSSRLGDAMPSMQPLLDAIARTRANDGQTTSAPAAASVTTAVVANPTPSVEAPTPATTPSADVDHPRAWAARWLAPISPDAPHGRDTRNEPLFLSIREAIQMADHPAGAQPNWSTLVASCDRVLLEHSKDLRTASFRAYAAYRDSGLPGLAESLAILGALIELQWDGLFPSLERSARARASALAWLLPRLDNLSAHPVTRADLDRVERVAAAASYLVEQVQQRLAGSDAPATRPLLEQVERLRLSVPAAVPPPTAAAPATNVAQPSPPLPSAPAANPNPQPPSAGTGAAVQVVATPPARPSGADVSQVRAYLRTLGRDLMQIADQLLEADSAAPEGYRLARIAMYGAINADPPAPAGRITVAAPEFALGGLERLMEAQQWQQLLTTAEKTARVSPFLIDAQRFVILAMQQLGPSHAAAKAVAVGELTSLLLRAPKLLDLAFSDGKPLCRPATRDWIASTLLSPGASHDADTDGTAPELSKAKVLGAEGKTKEAIALLESVATQTASGRSSFRARLAMAEIAAAARGANSLAEGLYAALVDEADQHHLESWEPDLALQLLSGYLRCLKAFPKEDRLMADRSRMIYRRLCRIDPVRAMATGE